MQKEISKQQRERFEKNVRERKIQLFGRRYEDAHLSGIRCNPENQDKLLKFVQSPKNFLVYCGSPGIGKTYLCAAFFEWASNNFSTVRYWNESELLKRVRASMDEFKGDYLDALKYLIDDQFVMLDDIGSTGLNQWRSEVFFDALDERYNTMLPTVFTTNFSSEEIKRNFHPRVYSRLFDKENVVIEINDGIDQRLN